MYRGACVGTVMALPTILILTVNVKATIDLKAVITRMHSKRANVIS